MYPNKADLKISIAWVNDNQSLLVMYLYKLLSPIFTPVRRGQSLLAAIRDQKPRLATSLYALHQSSAINFYSWEDLYCNVPKLLWHFHLRSWQRQISKCRLWFVHISLHIFSVATLLGADVVALHCLLCVTDRAITMDRGFIHNNVSI